eukprot:Sdes_comp19052_c0_seq1m9642
MSAFEEFGVMPEIIEALEDMDWFLPTGIQAEAIPQILGGGDVMLAAETGSGKTGAFCIPLLQVTCEALRLRKKQPAKAASSLMEVDARDAAARLNSGDKSSSLLEVTDGGLTAVCQGKHWQGIRASVGVKSGCYYYEVKVNHGGLVRVGWSTLSGSYDIGTDFQSFGYGGTGKKSFGKKFEPYGEPFGINDIVGCAIDVDSGSVFFP